VSGLLGLQAALTLAAAGMLAGLLLARPFPLRMGELDEVTQVKTSRTCSSCTSPTRSRPGGGGNRLPHQRRRTAAFLDAVSQLRAPRRRDGATFWRVYRDLSDPQRYVERFIVTSWADYLHQRARATVADQELEARVQQFLLPGVALTTQHYVAEL
jgi:hypothetical protein